MEPDRLQVIQGDSRAMTSDHVRARAAGGGVRIFSVDGSHTAEATLADVATAAGALAPGGVVVIGRATRARTRGSKDAPRIQGAGRVRCRKRAGR
jgi:hypothetical protein